MGVLKDNCFPVETASDQSIGVDTEWQPTMGIAANKLAKFYNKLIYKMLIVADLKFVSTIPVCTYRYLPRSVKGKIHTSLPEFLQFQKPFLRHNPVRGHGYS